LIEIGSSDSDVTYHEIEEGDLGVQVSRSRAVTVQDESREHGNLKHEEDNEGTEDSIDVKSLCDTSKHETKGGESTEIVNRVVRSSYENK
jgi:hypothetical protein